MVRWLLIAASMLVSGPAHAADWRLISQAQSKTLVLVDITSVKKLPAVFLRDFEVVQVWVKFDHRFDKSEKARETLKLFRVDCIRDSMNTIELIKRDAKGSVLENESSSDDYATNYSSVSPDSIGSDIVAFACGRRTDAAEN